jgi:hypothetical protein
VRQPTHKWNPQILGKKPESCESCQVVVILQEAVVKFLVSAVEMVGMGGCWSEGVDWLAGQGVIGECVDLCSHELIHGQTLLKKINKIVNEKK